MKSRFIDRVIMSTLVIALPLALFWGSKGQAICLGALWGSANLFVLKHLVLKMLDKNKKNYLHISLLCLLKCPILYVGGYLLLEVPSLPPAYLLLGFSLLFVMMTLYAFKTVLRKKASI